VALAPIDHGGARAYNPGDFVPADNVKEHGYDKAGLVAKRGSKAAQQANKAANQQVENEPAEGGAPA